MTRFRWRRSTPRSLVFVLTVLLLLGHACELPVLAEAFAHVHESGHHAPGHHSPDHDPDANQVSCDALVGIRTNTGGSPDLGPSLDTAGVPAVADAVSSRVAAAPPRESTGPLRRPPLFLLYASFLI
jgi:hypothetical protein